jgi:uncharacterized protein (DUF58 family)
MSLASSIVKPFRTTVRREAWYYLFVLTVVAVAAMIREINLLLVLAGMIAGPLWLSWRMVRSNLRGLRVARRVPESVCAGDLLVVNLEVAGSRRLGSWAVVVEDQIARADRKTLRPCVYFSHVASGRTAARAYRGRLNERGRYEVGPLRLSTRFPFGLLQRTTTVGRRETVVVFPRLGRLTQAWLARHHEAFDGAEQRQQRFARVEGQFYGVRYWRRGDSRRSIHWRSTARQGQLVVCQYEQPRNRDIAVLVDLWQPRSADDQHRDCVELAVSFAATAIADLCRKGTAVISLATTSQPETLVAGPASPALMRDCMTHLAVAEADDEDHLPAMLESALDRLDSGTEIILVASRPVDLEDSRRFGRVRRDPARAAALRRVCSVDASGPGLARYFQAQ